jgi:mRNA interferase MazF
VVVTTSDYNARSGLMLCCPVTSRRRGLPFEVPLPDGGPVAGVVLSDHVKSVDWRARWARRIAPAAPEVVREIRARLIALIQ